MSDVGSPRLMSAAYQKLVADCGRALGCDGTPDECRRLWITELFAWLKRRGRKYPAANDWQAFYDASKELIYFLADLEAADEKLISSNGTDPAPDSPAGGNA